MPNLVLDADVVEDKETLGGGNQRVWEAGVYNVIIEMATIEESSGGATAINVTLKPTSPDLKVFPLRDTFWVISGKAKGQNPYYIDKKGVKKPLPGFTAANRMCIAAINKNLNDTVATGEKKMINVYSYEAKKEVPTEKFVLTELIGKPVQIAVQAFKRNKQKKEGNAYVDTADTFETNEIRYFANTVTGLSVGEMADGETEATFMKDWHEKNAGTVIDQVKDVASTPAAASTTGSGSVFG